MSPATNYLFTTPQRNDIFKAAVELGLDTTPFKFTAVNDGYGNVLPRIEHPPSKAFFQLHWVANPQTSRVRIDCWPQVEVKSVPARDWELLLTLLNGWLRHIKTEVETPDLWKTARDQRAWLTSTAADFDGNTPFTPIEREQIRLHLKTIADYTINTNKLDGVHRAYVEDQLKYLVEAVDRVPRVDWKNIAISTLFGIVINLSLDTEKGRKLFDVAAQLLGPLVTGAEKLIGM